MKYSQKYWIEQLEKGVYEMAKSNGIVISNDTERIKKALGVAMRFAGIDELHHRTWVIDQMIRALTGCSEMMTDSDCYEGDSSIYKQWIEEYNEYENGSYEKWDVGIAP